MFLVILFLISGKVIVGGEDSDESKYIDLLPEEEKENFLQRIAKRIFEENNVANAEAKVSGELHDEQLEQHDDFVNKILKEETTNARRDEADDQDDGFKVKPLERERRSDFNEEVVSGNVADTNVDGNIELYDGSKNHTVSEEKDTDSKESEIILIKPLPEEDIASTDTVNYNYDETNQTTATDDMLSTTYGTPIQITEKPEIFLNETHIFLKARLDSNLTVERSQDENFTYPINIIEATTNDFRNPTITDEGVEVISEDTPTNIDTNNTVTEASASQSDNNDSSILVNKTDSIVLSTTTNSTANDSEITTNNNIEYKNNLNVKNNVERSRVSQSFSSDNNLLNDKIKTKKENSDADNNNNALDENLSDYGNEKRPRLRKKPKNERESYAVYEIDPTRPFTAKGIITNAEQPHYVPIYDYSSKNAYFNPKNLNGPNHDNKEAITDTIKQMNTILNGYKVGDQLSLPVIAGNGNAAIGREMPQVIYASQHNDDAELLSSVHPYRSYIPDTNENFYSYSTMNGLKDGLSAVRKILYEKQRFGFVDPDKSFEYVSENFTGSPTDKTVLRETLKSDHKNAKFITDWSILKRISTKGENLPHPRNVLLSQKNRMKMKIPDTTKYIRLKDLLKAYDYLKEFSGNSKGRGDEVDAYVTVLNDMMITKNRMLRKYDWLGSTVKLRSAMMKLSSLLSSLEDNERIHSSDLEMLKYIFLLHNRAKTELLSEIRLLYRSLNQRNIQNGFPRRPQAYSNGMVRQKAQSVFLDRNEVDELKEILGLLANSLCDLHDALKYISIVTKSNKQRWYENLEELYIRNTKKQLLEILVHIFANEFVDLVEEGLQNGANEDSKNYLIYHGEHVNNTVNIYLTLMKLLRKFIKLKIL